MRIQNLQLGTPVYVDREAHVRSGLHWQEQLELERELASRARLTTGSRSSRSLRDQMQEAFGSVHRVPGMRSILFDFAVLHCPPNRIPVAVQQARHGPVRNQRPKMRYSGTDMTDFMGYFI